MASGEIRLEGATAYLVGERGRGFKQMADMINKSRLSNGMRAAGMMRRALHRGAVRRRASARLSASGSIEMPLMRRQLLKLMLPAEQARTMCSRRPKPARADAGDADAAARCASSRR